ncbi:MFS transporter [Brevibacillus centrosporus]|uniref:MFS transporter n=1 Tax=Brevibacillus centrosporus TaxID=54910 RepID=UPI00399D4B2F
MSRAIINLGRALSFGFWSYGTSGSNFFAALIAGYTLPYFGTWQSQFYIAGFLSLIVAVFVLFTFRPQREQVQKYPRSQWCTMIGCK